MVLMVVVVTVVVCDGGGYGYDGDGEGDVNRNDDDGGESYDDLMITVMAVYLLSPSTCRTLLCALLWRGWLFRLDVDKSLGFSCFLVQYFSLKS